MPLRGPRVADADLRSPSAGLLGCVFPLALPPVRALPAALALPPPRRSPRAPEQFTNKDICQLSRPRGSALYGSEVPAGVKETPSMFPMCIASLRSSFPLCADLTRVDSY